MFPEILAKLPERIAKKIQVGGAAECWPWTGCFGWNGYGLSGLHGRKVRVHRLVLEAKLGRKLKSTEESRHKCHYKPCCNPDHLEEGSHQDNVADTIRAGRQAQGDRQGLRLHPEARAFGDRNGSRTHPEKRPRGEAHAGSTHSETEVVSIFDLRRQGLKGSTIALQLGCNREYVYKVLGGKIWKHLGLFEESQHVSAF